MNTSEDRKLEYEKEYLCDLFDPKPSVRVCVSFPIKIAEIELRDMYFLGIQVCVRCSRFTFMFSEREREREREQAHK